jgi:glycosyltransferase involved in cell wall biosynthesis
MKLVVIAESEFPYTYGGIETHVHYLVKYLSRISDDVEIILLVKNLQGKKYFEGIENSCRIIKAGLPGKVFSSRLLTTVYHWIRIASFNLHSLIKVLSLEADIVHYHYGLRDYSGLFVPFLKLFRRSPIITTVHSLGIKDAYIGTFPKTLRDHLAFFIGTLIERAVFLISDSIIVLSPTDIKKSVFIPQGVDLENFRFIQKNNYQRYIYVGRIEPAKSVMELIMAFKRICGEFPGELVLIGDGPQLGEVQDYVKKNIDDGRVKVLGPISNVGEELRNGGIFVLFSQHEGFSVSLLEAMATGLPTIITPVGTHPFFFEGGKHTLFVKQGDIEDLAEKMLMYYRDRELADKIREQAYECVSYNFAWDTVAAKTLELYKRVISSKGQSPAPQVGTGEIV